MEPLAVDWPPPDVDCNAYASAGAADFGDDLMLACSVPPDFFLAVVAQAQFGTVEFSGGGSGWRYVFNQPAASGVVDSFTYHVTNGVGQHSEPATVTLQLVDA